MNFNDLYKMVVEKVTIQPNAQDPFEQELINHLKSSEYNLDKIVSWYRRDKKSGVPQSELERIYDTNLDDMISTFVDYYTEVDKYRKLRGNDPRFLKNPFEQYRYSKGFFQNIEKIKFEINELRDENIRLANSSGKKKDGNGEFDIRPEDETRIKLIDSSTNVMVWSTEDFDTTNRFIFNFWGNANMNVEYGNPDINSPYCTRIWDNWESYSENSATEQYQQIWFFLKPKGNYDYSTGDLTKPSVAELFRACNLQGPKLLLCMDDTGFDLLDRYDDYEEDSSVFGDNEYINPVIEEVKKLDKRFRDKISTPLNKLAQDELVKTGKIPPQMVDFVTQIEILNSVTSIGDWAFEGCSSLTNVTIPDSVTSIGNSVFYNCNSLKSITIPDSVTSIGDYAFYGCSGLTSITIPNSVTSIGEYAFYNCRNLINLTIPDSVTSIGDYTFYNCKSLTSITIPNSVTSIGDNAFYNCNSLKSITIPDSVTSIEKNAFEYCYGLTSVTIPDSVTSIEKNAFEGCKKLTIQTTPRVAKLLRNSGFLGVIEKIKPEDSLMREFIEVLKMEEY